VKKWLGFLLLSLAVFWLAFGPIGRTLSDWWTACFTWIKPPGLLGALWTVATTLLGLLPQILILFSFFHFFDSPSHVIMGFGCTTVAVSATKSKRTAILLPFIPCSAKAPVVLLVAGVLRLNFFVIFLLYVFCVVVGLVVSRVACKRQSLDPFDCAQDDKLGPIRMTFQFFKRISGTVLIAAAVLYFLSNYTFYFQHTSSFNQSILYWLCKTLSPLFVPIGLGNPAVIAALVFGFLGKELVAASIVLTPFVLTTASLSSFIIFFMLYPPCVSAIRAIATQTDKRTATLSVTLNFLLAYTFAFITYCVIILL